MKKQLKRLNIVRQLSSFAFSLASKLPTRKKLVVFESFSGKQYSCNPRAIYEYMRDANLDYELVWSVNKNHKKKFSDNHIPHVERLSLKWFLLMARARYWVTNSRMPNWINKPNHTIYVQTWHGTPLKRLVSDMEHVRMPGTTKEKYVENFHKEARQWDYLLSPNSYSTEIFKRAFQFSNEVLQMGYPRNDILVTGNSEENIKHIREKFTIPNEKKVLLYAPTWRDHQNSGPGSYHFDLKLDLKKLQEVLGHEYILMLRMHSFISEKLNVQDMDDFVLDVSEYHDINELYLVADMLITDYSSVFFDYAILNRPIIFFAYDLEEYRDDIRGFYFPLEEKAPGPIVQTTDELLEVIQTMQGSNENFNQFTAQFCSLEDGGATKRVVDAVFEKNEGASSI
ncbi:CDP-glycerol glycerophosphotransferase family protein [Shouchella miscanthi]|uniref:CDP-glycerol glycerophosphotransferase family protein n=1 Tax=Shouchella miscanthi TaxID=2598861 RepID=A0ABU6NR63_9BACI|nr:CDP-glycerol glycerophosphotransferase family protein [Shouchella miscanthi]MED4130209.1 CDP-glycerol glycerophosphotransferase family protein [Shouchella miscanthi]